MAEYRLVCPICQVSFIGKRSDTIYCSKKCYKKMHYEKYHAQHLDFARLYHHAHKQQKNEYSTKYRIKQLYGISWEDREYLLKLQNNSCAICKVSFIDNTPGIDHCHVTNKVRGVLCKDCNTGLGHFEDNPEWLRAAVDYIEKHRQE